MSPGHSARRPPARLITLRHSRGRRPAQRTRTPSACISSPRRRMTSRLKPIRKRTSSGRALPVLGGERVRRQVADAELDAALDDVEQRRLARLVALGPRQPALLGPAPVAVHDQRDVLGHQLARDRRRAGAGRVRRRRPDRDGASGGRGAAVTDRHLPRTGASRSARRSTSGSERSWRSRCHCRCAATSPLASRRVAGVGGVGDRPVAVAAARPSARALAGAGVTEPGGRQPGTPRPRPATWNARCGPGAAAAGALGERRAPSRRAPWRAAGRRRAPATGRARGRRAPAARRPPAGTAAATGSPLLGGEPLGGLQRSRRPRCSGGSRRRAPAPNASRVSAWVTTSRLRPV